MPSRIFSRPAGVVREPTLVSLRFLADFFQTLEGNGVPATQLVGDLPLTIGELGDRHGFAEWTHFVEFMNRLEKKLGGAEGLEAAGAAIGQLKPARTLRGLAGLSASPAALYHASVRWALTRALPGVHAEIDVVDDNQIEIHARLSEGMRACPSIFHFATGACRALPRILGLADAVVVAQVAENEASYRITLPPSASLFARARRALRVVFSAGSVLRSLETQQLELHTQHDALQKAHAALAASEGRYRALTDAAVDVICEVDADGRIIYISASVQDLIGYTPEQVTGSHYRLWIPRRFHAIADARFEAITSLPPGFAISQELITLHSEQGEKIVAEISVRSHETADGQWRMVGTLRDVTERVVREHESHALLGAQEGASVEVPSVVASIEGTDSDRLRDALARFAAPTDARVPGTEAMRTSDARAPLERSLTRLLAALESHASENDPNRLARLDRSTAHMSRILESSLDMAIAGSDPLEWIETRKLLENVSFQASNQGRSEGLSLQVEQEDGIAEIYGQADLLASGLGSLVGQASRTAERPSHIELRASRIELEDSAPGIEFELKITPAARRPGRRKSAEPQPDDEAARLAGAIAEDAAAAHGGEVTTERFETGEIVSRFRIPQPASSS